MEITKEKVYDIENNLLSEGTVWEQETNEYRAMFLAYREGIVDMARAICAEIGKDG